MKEQLTLSELILHLQDIEKEYGGDLEVEAHSLVHNLQLGEIFVPKAVSHDKIKRVDVVEGDPNEIPKNIKVVLS